MSSSEEPQTTTTTTETSDVAVAAESTTTTTTTATADVETAPPVVDIVQEAQVVQAEPEEEVKQEDEAVKDEVKNSQEAPATEIETETETKPETTETTEKEQKQPAAKNGTAGGKYEPEQYRKVFIGSLSYSTVEEGLRKHFSQFGEIIDCVVMKEGKSNKSRGFGFVTYSCSTMVDELMKNRPHKLDGRELETKRATPREEIGKPGAEASVNKLFVGAIRDGVNEESLKEYFSKYGTILDCVIMREKDSQKSRGFGFITFDDYDPVDKIVLEKFHTINGQSIAVKKALTKEQQQVGPIVNHHSNGHDAKPYSRPRSQKAGAANQGQNNRNQQQQQNGGGGGGNKNNRNHGNHGNHHYNRNNNNNHYNNAAVNYGNDYFPNAAVANYPPMNNNINNQGYYQSYNQPGPDRYSNNNNNYHNQHYHQPNNSHYSNNQVDYNSGYDNYDDKPMNGNGYNHHHIAANDYSPNQSYSSNNTGVVSPNVGGGGNNNNNNNNPIGNMNLGNIALFAQKMLQAASMQLQTGGGGSVTGTVPNPQVPLGAGQQRKNTNMNMINNDDLNGGYDSYSNNNSSGGGYGINNNNVGYHNNNNNNGMMGSGPNTGMYGGGGGMMDNGIMNNSQQQMGGGGQVGPIRAHNGMGGGGRGRQNGPYGGGRRKN